MTETSTDQPTSERLIPEDQLREAIIDRDWPFFRSDTETLDIAETRLLLGLPADTDLVSGEFMLRIVRRLVLLERAAGVGGDPVTDHLPRPISPDADPARLLAVTQEAYRDLLATGRAYKRERDTARDRLDRLTCAADLYLSATEERHAYRLERLTDEIEAAQQLLAQPWHDEDLEAQP